MTRRIFAAALLAVVALVVLPVAALAADASSADLVGAVSAVWPAASPWLALLPVIQLVAKLLAPLPGRIGGFTHSTVWSRALDTIAAFPAAPAARPSAPPTDAP